MNGVRVHGQTCTSKRQPLGCAGALLTKRACLDQNPLPAPRTYASVLSGAVDVHTPL